MTVCTIDLTIADYLFPDTRMTTEVCVPAGLAWEIRKWLEGC